MDDDEDQKVFDGMARALKPGGQLVLDVRNRDRILADYRDSSRSEFANGTVLSCRSSFDIVTGRNVEAYHWRYADGTERDLSAVIRLYTVPELVRMMKRAGLALHATFGDYESGALTVQSKRWILVAVKPL